MDLISITQNKVKLAGDGDHAPGLRAVLLHIETAVSHLYRGQETADETAYTDAIYRTNQAFEGSLKEAYRVLTDKAPEKKSPYQIEEYFTKNDKFRSRVLAQFKNYRTEWRNPSTHDYKLDFDSSEAFLAIVSVCAFANLLLDQVIEKIAHDRAKSAADKQKDQFRDLLKSSEPDFLRFASQTIIEFFHQNSSISASTRMTESEFQGALSGFIESVAPNIKVKAEMTIHHSRNLRPDLILERAEERIVVELKGARLSTSILSRALDQLDQYMIAGEIQEGILVLIDNSAEKIALSETKTPNGKRVIIIASKTFLDKRQLPE